MRRYLIIFAKEPKEGMIKTRLSNYLSKKERINLYKAFLKDTINLAKNIPCEERILAYESNKNPEYLKKIACRFRFYKQKGKDLGERMHNAFKLAKRLKSSKTVIIGSDSPTLPVNFIKDAYRRLNRNDVVLGPSYDGGYYLIGLKRPCLGLFKGVEWSTGKVLHNTIKNSRILKKRITLLDEWYDIDDSESFTHLKWCLKKEKNKNIGKWTRRFLRI